MKKAVILVIFYLCWITFKNYRKLGSEKADTELDTMSILFAGIENHISPDSQIAFKTNAPSDRHGVLYFKSALVLAPAVLQLESGADTVLLLEELALPATALTDYAIIAQGANRRMKYTLMRPKR
ncbi:hypothetical protein [Dyadobacter aurulentus]|uniref:hypothetical protein n=1 Tax=Dyadobacter sp. UC 10 TaxID=2605428 RepID=UPI0011F0E602|nr:hypothetical protein [Dyadobacter sp. UC 10]KAA0988840.1 hypothetical protein FXO21_01010 [Dyadobacter sp. UC 10]